jgi:hypothetical protein
VNGVIVQEVLEMAETDYKAWYYWRNPGDKNWHVLAFVNRGGACSIRQFRSTDGARSKYETKAGSFHEAFSEYFSGPPVFPLELSAQPNLEKECRERLPQWVLIEIRKQIKELTISLVDSL